MSLKKCIVVPLLSESAQKVVIMLGVMAGLGMLAGGVYVVLTKLQIINKKIDPRKIRYFPKMRK